MLLGSIVPFLDIPMECVSFQDMWYQMQAMCHLAQTLVHSIYLSVIALLIDGLYEGCFIGSMVEARVSTL
jgi:hypothetical protein